MAELINLLLLLILGLLWILSIDIKMIYKWLERTCNYLRFSHWIVAYALLIMKRVDLGDLALLGPSCEVEAQYNI